MPIGYDPQTWQNENLDSALEATRLNYLEAAMEATWKAHGAAASRSTAVSTNSGGFWTPIQMNTELYDTDGMFTATSSRITCVAKGIYQCAAHAGFHNTSSVGARGLKLAVNNLTSYAISVIPCPTDGSGPNLSVAFPILLNVGDYVEAQTYQTSLGALNVVSAQLGVVLLGLVD